jgi:catechol 2,3-dioxygenase-like lactoylglutathione lyase family enzyme
MARIIALDHIVLNVADVERSLAFYSQTLGLPAERVEAWRRGELRFPSVRVNEATIIDLVKAEERATEDALNLGHYCLVTDAEDLAAVQRELEAAGVVIERGPGMRSGARGNALSLYFRDPDNNLIELRTYAGVE